MTKSAIRNTSHPLSSPNHTLEEQKSFASFLQKRRIFFLERKKQRTFALLLALTAAAPDPIVAVRGSDELTASQVRALIAAVPAEQRKKLEQSPEALRGLIRDTFLQHAILAEASAQKWDQKPDVAALLKRVREQTILQSYVAAQSQPPAGYPSESEVEAAYDHARPQLTQPRTYHLSQLFIPFDADAPANTISEARKTLTALAHDITAGRTQFQDAAKHTAGVHYIDLGWVTESQLQKAAKSAVAGLPEGQVTPPICNADACTLIKLIATRPAGPPPLAEVREQLVQALREQKRKELASAYANSLLTQQPVRVDEIQLSHITNP